MSHDNVFALKNPAVANEVRDALTEVLREGARTLLAQAIEAEVAEFLARHGDKRDAPGLLRGHDQPRLKAVWQAEHAHWDKRSLTHKR